MAQSMLTVRMDKGVKDEFIAICEQLGMNASTAVNLLARQMVANRALPFTPSLKHAPQKEGPLSMDAIEGTVTSVALRYPAISAVTLFGSYARNEATAASDIDLRIEYDAREGFSVLDLAAFVDEVEERLGRSVDAVSKRTLDASLDNEITRDGVRVYERTAA